VANRKKLALWAKVLPDGIRQRRSSRAARFQGENVHVRLVLADTLPQPEFDNRRRIDGSTVGMGCDASSANHSFLSPFDPRVHPPLSVSLSRSLSLSLSLSPSLSLSGSVEATRPLGRRRKGGGGGRTFGAHSARPRPLGLLQHLQPVLQGQSILELAFEDGDGLGDVVDSGSTHLVGTAVACSGPSIYYLFSSTFVAERASFFWGGGGGSGDGWWWWWWWW